MLKVEKGFSPLQLVELIVGKCFKVLCTGKCKLCLNYHTAEIFEEVLYFSLFSEFPPIADDHERENYKSEFDRDHQVYKSLQAELDEINKRLAEVDRELDELQEGTPQYLVRENMIFCLGPHHSFY